MPLAPAVEVSDSLFGSTETEQPVLPFTQISKGIMESTIKVFWQNRDLDIPTYIRNDIADIDNGKIVPKNVKAGN